MKRHVLAVLAYVVATFITQATSHFGINAGHYAALNYMRKDPIFPLGILLMLIQGAVLSYFYARMTGPKRSIASAVEFAWMSGAILVSYIALGEAAKYQVPSITSWLLVEGMVGLVQFSLYGILLGLIYRHFAEARHTARQAA